MISFIIPAHNEGPWLGGTIVAIRGALAAVGEPYEIVVAADACTDVTAQVATEHAARVVSVAHRQIAATRNSGARAARGELFFFVDADTLANREAIQAALRALRDGAVGGGCVFTYDRAVPLWARILHPISVPLCRWFKRVGGCFLFCTRAAFEATGGFCETRFAAEEFVFIRALKRQGRFFVPRPTVVTSARKLHSIPAWEVPSVLYRFLRKGSQREHLDFLYGERSEKCRGRLESA